MVKAASWIQKDTPFYLVSGDTAAVTLHLRGHPSIPYSLQDLAPSQLATWVFNQRRETVLRLTDSHNLLYLKNQKDFLDVLVLIDSSRDESSDIFLSVHGYCQGEKASVLCATIPKDDPNFQQFEDSFNFRVEDHSVVLFRNRYQVGYVYPEGQAQTADDVRDFVEKARSDALPRAFDHFTKKHEVADIEYESVRMLDAGSYNSTLQENRFVLVEYYSPHCGHCTRFAKDYDRVAAQLSGEVVVAAVDASRERAIAALEGVKGYPTFKIFVGGEGVKYEGTRTAEAIVQFALEFARSRLLIVQKRKDLNLPAVAIGGIQVGSPLHSLPALYSRLPVYMVLDDEFSVEIHEESGVKRYEGEHSLIKIANWLEAETSPVLVSLGYPTPCPKLKKAMEDKLPILGLVIKGHHPANFALEFLEQYCREKSQIICGHISKGEPDYADMVQWLGDTDQDRNRLYIIQTDGLKKYAYPGSPATLVAAELDQWVADVLAGKLPTHDPAANPTDAQTAE